MNAAQLLADIEMQSRGHLPDLTTEAAAKCRQAFELGMLRATVKSLCAELAIATKQPLTASDITDALEALQGAADKLSAEQLGRGWDAVTDAIGKAIEKVYECGSFHHEEDPRDVAPARLYEVTR